MGNQTNEANGGVPSGTDGGDFHTKTQPAENTGAEVMGEHNGDDFEQG